MQSLRAKIIKNHLVLIDYPTVLLGNSLLSLVNSYQGYSIKFIFLDIGPSHGKQQ